ncbi:MAG: flagellar basal body P-ring formation chaperone FlgA [Hyphomonadaceae bacterium]
MHRTFAFLACIAALAAAPLANADQRVELRAQIEAAGPAVTLGDVFLNAGEMGGRAVAPAPAAGARAAFSARFLVAAAAAAGLDWTPPDGVEQVIVTRAGGARLQKASFAPEPVVRRGETVTLVYVAPGLQLTTRAKALADAGLGAAVKLVNLQSNKAVDAVVTGPGAATANRGQSF